MDRLIQQLGKPDGECAGWKIWMFSRDEEDWLQVYSVCTVPHARVQIDGRCILIGEVRGFIAQLQNLQVIGTGEAMLGGSEGELRVNIVMPEHGQPRLLVAMRDYHGDHRHEFSFAIDQSVLPELCNGLTRALQRLGIQYIA